MQQLGNNGCFEIVLYHFTQFVFIIYTWKMGRQLGRNNLLLAVSDATHLA